MKSFLWVAWLLYSLGAGQVVRAQQFLCERQLLANLPRYQKPALLLRLAPDSLRLVGEYFPGGSLNGQYTRVQRLNVNTCDTLPTGPAVMYTGATEGSASVAATNRRGQVLVANRSIRMLSSGIYDSARIVLKLFNRNGTSPWHRMLSPKSIGDGISDIIEAPGNGFFLLGGEYYIPPTGMGPPPAYDIVLRIDSTGRELWRRRYRSHANANLANPVYTRSGNLVCTADTTPAGQARTLALKEFDQLGNAIRTRPIVVVPQQNTQSTPDVLGSLLPLRDGGFALVGVVDSANTGATRPFLARLDRNLNLTWVHIHRQRLAYYFAQPQELADGSLVVVASNGRSGRGNPFWLFRFSAAGAWQQAYPFVSQALTTNTNNGRGYFGIAQGLKALSDSTFVVAAGYADLTTSRIYLAHLRVPGLPRVIDSHYVPAAQPLATRTGRAAGAALELFPNPATETVTVRYLPPAGHAPATLTLSDVLGRTVLTQPLGAVAEATVSVRGLPAGLYQATVRAAGQAVAAGKLAITR